MAEPPFLSSSWHRVATMRPRLRAHVSVSRHRYRGGSWYILHDPTTGGTHRLSPKSFSIVGEMDGTRSVDEVWRAAALRLGEEAPSQDDIIHLLAQLHSADLLQSEVTADSAELLERSTKARRSVLLRNLLNPLSFRVRLWHPDKFFEFLQPLAAGLFGPSGAFLWAMVVLPAVVLTALNWSALSDNAPDRILAADNIVLIALAYPILKALHEFGHGLAVKAFGGQVHEIGLMFIVFAPMPYVDASAASEFRSKWRRALVGAAGMAVEVFLAALALYVWLLVEPGLVRAIAYDVMLIAGISTLIFNGNPLLRFDGYYILSDLLEIPNLAQRAAQYWRNLVDTHVFWIADIQRPRVAPGESLWLFFYAPASFAYRQFVTLTIALFIASQYLAVGVAIAIWSLATGLALPIGKALRQVATSPLYRRNRLRVSLITAAFVAGAAVLLFMIPAPLSTTTEGVVWLPESANVRAGTSGFVRRVLVESGQLVAARTALIESEEWSLASELTILQARVEELEAALASERFVERARAEITKTELGHARAELAYTTERMERLITRSRADGVFAVFRPDDLPGRFVKEGQLIGYVLPPGSPIIRAVVRQDDIELVRNRLAQTRVKLSERLDETFLGQIIREVPAGRDELPSKALGGTGGGTLSVDPRDPQGTKALQRFFQVDVELASGAAAAFGGRAYVRFEHHWEPIGQQVWRRARQLVLSRMQT